jgi:hypothetical protein
MEEDIIVKIEEFLEETNYNENTSNDFELDEAAKELNVTLNEQYRFFVKKFGGCHVGLDVFALKNSEDLEQISFVDLTKSFREQGYPNMNDKYVISFDGAGNPISQNSKGEVLIFDHNIGEYTKLANSFSELISNCI